MIPGMSDRPTDQATGRAATHTIADAARLLGVSENAVRKRIRRGTLPAYKEGDRWLVAIPTTPATTGQAGDYPPATTDLAADQVAPATGQAADLAAAITPLAALIERLTAENRELAEAATVWQGRARHLEEQMKQLTAGQDTPPASAAVHHAPDDDDEDDLVLTADRPLRGPSAPIGPPAWRTTETAEAARLPWWRRWWERWR